MGKAFEEKVARHRLNAERAETFPVFSGFSTDVSQSAAGETWRYRAPDSFPSFILNDTD